MTQQAINPPATEGDPLLTERIVSSTIGTLELFTVHLGRALGLYDSLTQGPVTFPELAARAGIAPRYAREWLEQQAAAGLVAASTDESPEGRTYELPAAHQAVLLDPTDPAHVGPLADMVAGIAGVLDRLPAAFRTGDGVPYADYGAAFRHGQGAINRPTFVRDLPGLARRAQPGDRPTRFHGRRTGRRPRLRHRLVDDRPRRSPAVGIHRRLRQRPRVDPRGPAERRGRRGR